MAQLLVGTREVNVNRRDSLVTVTQRPQNQHRAGIPYETLHETERENEETMAKSI